MDSNNDTKEINEVVINIASFFSFILFEKKMHLSKKFHIL